MRASSTIGILIGTAIMCVAPASLTWTSAGGLSASVDRAEARIGRPATATSIAGVNRRMHRRAYYGAAYGAHPYVAHPACGVYPNPPCY